MATIGDSMLRAIQDDDDLPRRLEGWIILLVCAFAWLSTACATPWSHTKWYAFEADTFTVYAQVPATRHPAFSRKIRFAQDVAGFFTNRALLPTAPRAHFLLTKDEALLRDRDPSRGVSFVAAEGPEASRYLVDADTSFSARPKGLEQALAHYSLQAAPDVSPFWFEVGIAEFLDSLDVRGDDLFIGQAKAGAKRKLLPLRDGEHLEVAALLEPGGLARSTGRRRQALEALAGLVVHHLTLGGSYASHGAPAERFVHYTRALAEGSRPEDALEAAWGLTAAQLGERIMRGSTSDLPRVRFSRDRIDRAHPALTIRELGPSEVALARAEIYLALGEHALAESAFDRALEARARSVRVQTGLAQLEARTGRLEAGLERATRIALRSPDDPTALLTRAQLATEAARATAIDSQREEHLKRARRDLIAARRSIPEDSPERVALLVADANRRRIAAGRPTARTIDALERAHAMAPTDRTIRLALLAAHVENGESRRARELAGSLRSDARTRGEIDEVASLMAMLPGGDAPRPWRSDDTSRATSP